MKELALLLISFCLFACGSPQTKQAAVTELQNPVIPGYFADPSIVQHDGKFYMYVTADPWGADFLSCWVSDDFRNWTFNKLNWPTKAACTSPNSNDSKVWAPSVIKKGDMFYMYISVGSEIWCGKAPHPLGPWENMLGDQVMIPYDTTRFYHVIDAEVFIDDDNRSYLYWGSGWNWINGHCYAAELNDDMCTFRTEPVEVTPTRYFEGPLMVKHGGKYFLTYSEGKTNDETYEVRYAVGDNPMGPFTEAPNSPVLTMNEELQVYGPGHHTVFTFEGKSYILYHKHSLPFVTGTAMRQTCINELVFDETNGLIETIIPYTTQAFPCLTTNPVSYIQPESVAASSEAASHTAVSNVLDNHYGTRWEASREDSQPTLTATFKENDAPQTMEILFEYAWKTYHFRVESSTDNQTWNPVADYSEQGVTGSPVQIRLTNPARHIRVSFTKQDEETNPAIWEVKFY